jgi:hypothetical protein
MFRIRGQVDQVKVAKCTSFDHAIQQGQRLFDDFDNRNPWIFIDSIRQRMHVLLDPEQMHSPAVTKRPLELQGHI